MKKKSLLTLIACVLLISALPVVSGAEIFYQNEEVLPGTACRVDLNTANSGVREGYVSNQTIACNPGSVDQILFESAAQLPWTEHSSVKIIEVKSSEPDKYAVFNKIIDDDAYVGLQTASKTQYDENSSEYQGCESQESCTMTVASGLVCGETISFSQEHYTNSISALNTYALDDPGDSTRCTPLPENYERLEIGDEKFTLPLNFPCESYQLRVIENEERGEWPDPGTYNIRQSDDTTYKYTASFEGGDNRFELTLTTNSANQLEKIDVLMDDQTPAEGGLSYEIQCVNPVLDADESQDVCEDLGYDWNGVIANQSPEDACCGDDENDFGETYDVGSGVTWLCSTSGAWIKPDASNCNFDYMEANNIGSVTELSPAVCEGEVLRNEQNNSYLPAGSAWYQARGSCSIVKAGNSEYLDVNPETGGDSGDDGDDQLREATCGDGVCQESECGSCAQDCDADGDGYEVSVCGEPSDCNDDNPAVNPDADEICGNELDENCDGVISECTPDDPFCDEWDPETGRCQVQTQVEAEGEAKNFETSSTTGFSITRFQSTGCTCQGNAVQPPDNCPADTDPVCTSSNTCECQQQGDTDSGSGTNAGNSTAADDLNNPYWAECMGEKTTSSGQTVMGWNNRQSPPSDDRWRGGINFKHTGEVNNVTEARVTCGGEEYTCVYNPQTGRGEWVNNASTKRSMDEKRLGYCADDNQCFKNTNEGCVQEDYWQDNNYCMNGSWTTRTRLVAEELLEIAENEGQDFKLFCDDISRSLINPNKSVTEQYCTLKLGDGNVVLGTALGSKPADTPMGGYMTTLEEAYKRQNNMGDDFNFSRECSEGIIGLDHANNPCVSEEDLKGYYDAEKKIILLSSDASAVEASFMDKLREFVSGLLGLEDESEFATALRDFDRLYLEEKGEQRVTAVYERTYNIPEQEWEDFIEVEYENVDVNADELRDKVPAMNKSVVTSGTTTKILFKNPRGGAEGKSWQLLSGSIRLN